MNKEQLTYIIIGIVAVIIIIFLINSNQPKQEITSPPILTLSPINTETSNLINIYDVSNDSILNPITTTLPPITTTLAPVSSTTTQPPFTTTLPPISTTTTLPPFTTTLAPVSTTLSPAQRSADIFANKQAELERKIKEQKQKEEDDLFNTPFIPVFNRDDWEAFTPGEGYYQVRATGSYYPCYNISTIRIKNEGIGYLGYENGGNVGSMFDNNDTTGVLFESHPSYMDTRFIVITMPVFKTFKGKLKMNFFYPWSFGLWLPDKMTINTSNSFTNDDLQFGYQNNLNFFNSMSPQNKFLESVSLEIKENIPTHIPTQSWDLDLKKPFNSIIFKFNGRGNPARAWITSIIFEKSR